MGRKRRGSQAFNFEQSQETLLQNETIVKLYQNKTFEPPEPKEFETILEEGNKPVSNGRVKRGQAQPSTDGSLVLGLSKSSRKILEYKYWKQDDKERNRKRKLMIQRLWKGRRREKIKALDCAGEQKLIDLIADRVSSDEEDEVCISKELRLNSVDNPLTNDCVWSAVETSNTKSQFSKKARTSSSDIDFGSQCVWTHAGLDDDYENINNTNESIASINSRRHLTSQTMETSQTNITAELSSRRESYSNELHELQGLIPESELAELLNTDDLLFCNEVKPKPNVTKGILGNIENVLPKKDSNHKESRKSLRRSARIMSNPHITGSIYTGDKSTQDGEKDTENKPLSENVNFGKKKKRVPDISCEDAPAQTEDSSHDYERTRDEKTSRKKRRSYSLEDGVRRYSLDGSKRNSLLTVTGDMEINISLPQYVRRSFSGERLSFVISSRLTPEPPCDTTRREEVEVSARREVEEPVKIRLPVPWPDSDTEDEEVIISGNMRSRHLKNKAKSRLIKK